MSEMLKPAPGDGAATNYERFHGCIALRRDIEMRQRMRDL